jgi:hypothetical protein
LVVLAILIEVLFDPLHSRKLVDTAGH